MDYEIVIPSVIMAGALAYYVLLALRRRERQRMFAYIADRWGMRFYSDIYSGLMNSLSGSYYGSLGHTRSGWAVLAGRQLTIPLAISDYRYELGLGIGRVVRKKTVFIAELPESVPSLVVLYRDKLLHYGRFADFAELSAMQDITNQPGIESAVRSYLNKCTFYCDRPELAREYLNSDLINALGKIKSADIEFMDNKLIIWSEPVTSKYRLIQIMARLTASARVIDRRTSQSSQASC